MSKVEADGAPNQLKNTREQAVTSPLDGMTLPRPGFPLGALSTAQALLLSRRKKRLCAATAVKPSHAAAEFYLDYVCFPPLTGIIKLDHVQGLELNTHSAYG